MRPNKAPSKRFLFRLGLDGIKGGRAASKTLKESGLAEVDALNGMLSQIAILVEPEALSHAIVLNKKYRAVYLGE